MNHLRLGVNIDHVATIRNARGGQHPDPVLAARISAAIFWSAPEQNARPAPVTTITQIELSWSASLIADLISSPIRALKALRRAGRLSVMIATRSLFS
jgi:hypothetical protein